MNISRFGIDFRILDSELNSFFFENYYQNWEESTYQFLFKYLSKDKVFIDIGAWVGPISLIASYFSKKVLAFEPDYVAYAELIENIRMNDIHNIRPSRYAISTLDSLTLGCPVLGQSGTNAYSTVNAFNARCITVKNIFERNTITPADVSVIKIDIEGHEEVLLQDEFLIGLNIPMHIALHPRLANDRDIFIQRIKPFFDRRGIDIEDGCHRKNFFDIEIP